MPVIERHVPNLSDKSLQRRINRSIRTTTVVAATYNSNALLRLRKAEQIVLHELESVKNEPNEYIEVVGEGTAKEWRRVRENPKAGKIAQLVKSLDTILERRRIVLGIGAPAACRPKDDGRMDDVKRALGAEPVDAVIVPESEQRKET